MSKTGTYVFDKESGALVKVSDRIPSVACDVFVPRDNGQSGGFKPYYEENLGHWDEKHEVYKPYLVASKRDKARRMKELGLVEKGGPDVKPIGKTIYHDPKSRGATHT